MTDLVANTKHLSASSRQCLSVRGLTKYFGDFAANSAVDLSVDEGEIHALLGENGAGKSTLVKMVYGVLRPDYGYMGLNSEPYSPDDPSDAKRAGVGMVFQHFAVFDALTVLENIALGLEGRYPGPELAADVIQLCERYGLHVELGRRIHDLGAGERQRVEIIRALMQNPRLLILDEPTSVLTPQETEQLFTTLDRLSDEGRSIIYISHKLEEVRVLCDRATLMRAGKIIDVVDPRQESTRSLGEKMIGERLRDTKRVKVKKSSDSKARLTVRVGDVYPDSSESVVLSDLYLSVAPGSILGISGVSGNGQDMLFDVLSGEVTLPNPDSIMLDDTPIARMDVEQRRILGLLGAPENRLGHAAVPDLTLWENIILTARHTRGILKNKYLISGPAAKGFADEVIQTFDVRTSSVNAKASSLSGGNLQKFLIGRELLGNPKVFIVSNPTWGVDAKAQLFIHQMLIKMADAGASIVMISQDIDELLSVSDRICAICHGRLSRTYPTEETTPDYLGALMLGQEVES
ncbi:MAG: ABC transporter [Gammaproteobacteria bacterium]|nr:ABC transporter [Gammaproteobacteria bacterium]